VAISAVIHWRKASEKWGDPPLWSPWNFHSPKPNREVYSAEYANSLARDENKIK